MKLRLPNARLRAAALGALLLAACQAAPDGPSPRTGAIAVSPVYRDAYRVRAAVSPNTAATVAGVTVTLRTVAAGVESSPVATSATLAPAAFATPLVFSHLGLNTTYRVRGTAYRSDGGVISVPSPSYVDVTVTDDAAPAIGTLPIQLTDVVFEGTATGGFTLVPGGYASPTAAPTFSQPSPSPS